MHRTKRKILTALQYSPDGTGGEGAAGGQTAGQQQGQAAGQQLPPGASPNSAVAQFGQQQTGQTQQTSTDDGDEKLGEGGKKALEAERAQRKALEKQLADAKAAQDKQLAEFRKALGLESGDTPEQLKAAADAAQQQVKVANAKVAVVRLAKDAGGDAAALLDSASFLEKLGQLDASDEAAVTAAIKAAVSSNKNLALVKVPPAGSGDAGRPGSGGSTTPSLDDLIRATRNMGSAGD